MIGGVEEREETEIHAAILGGLNLSRFIHLSDYCLITRVHAGTS